LKHCLITFLTARAEDYSLIAGLEAGADDYISKPIKPKVFSTKVAALLRRIGNTQDHTTSESDFSINQESYVVVHKGVEIILPKKEFELLNLLYSKKGKVFTRDEILSKVWGNDVVVGDRTIDVHIRKLREKLGNERIKTLKGIGYKLEE
jgi:two-component system alkaline phosphatase synthesis response regulator PhoP